MDESTTMTRRSVFAASALGVAALAGLADAAQGADFGATTEAEKKNLKLIEDFCKSFNDPYPDVKKILGFMNTDMVWTMGSAQPPAKGHEAITALLNNIVFKTPSRYELKISDSFARGPMVVHTRIDTRSVNGGPYQPAPGPIAGVFVIKDGKISEWIELFFPKAT